MTANENGKSIARVSVGREVCVLEDRGSNAFVSFSHILSVRSLIRIARESGVDPGDLLTRARLERSASALLSAELPTIRTLQHLPIENVYAVWDCAADWLSESRLLDDMVAALPPEGLGVLGFHMLTASSLARSIEHLIDGFTLITDSGRWTQHEGPDHVSLVFHRRALSAGQGLSTEAIFCHVVRILGDISGEALRPTRVTFQHSALWSTRALERLIPSKIGFDAPENLLSLPRALLAARPRLANPAMEAHFAHQVQNALALIGVQDDAVDRLRKELRSGYALNVESVNEVSQRIGMSVRTLQRRLGSARTSFSAELEHARRERALELVTSSARPFSEIATELGFAGASEFSRAFRRWFSEQPSVVRRVRRA